MHEAVLIYLWITQKVDKDSFDYLAEAVLERVAQKSAVIIVVRLKLDFD